jgi:hypothetical protein
VGFSLPVSPWVKACQDLDVSRRRKVSLRYGDTPSPYRRTEARLTGSTRAVGVIRPSWPKAAQLRRGQTVGVRSTRHDRRTYGTRWFLHGRCLGGGQGTGSVPGGKRRYGSHYCTDSDTRRIALWWNGHYQQRSSLRGARRSISKSRWGRDQCHLQCRNHSSERRHFRISPGERCRLSSRGAPLPQSPVGATSPRLRPSCPAISVDIRIRLD